MSQAALFPMLPFFLYLVAGIITGFHVFTLVLLGLYGAALNPLQLVSLLGSSTLLIAAYLSLLRPLAAAKLALVACLLIWCFYAPAISNHVRTKFAKHSSVSSNRLLR